MPKVQTLGFRSRVLAGRAMVHVRPQFRGAGAAVNQGRGKTIAPKEVTVGFEYASRRICEFSFDPSSRSRLSERLDFLDGSVNGAQGQRSGRNETDTSE